MNLLETLKELGGYWKYNNGKYLAELTSGKLSDTFVNTGLLTCRPGLLEEAVRELCANLVQKHSKFPTHVCAPATGGITLGYEIASDLNAYGPVQKRDEDCIAIFTEPVVEAVAVPFPKIEKRGQELKRFTIPEGANILFVEDVITTGKSTKEMMDAVFVKVKTSHNQCWCNLQAVVPYVLCLINRSGEDFIEANGSKFEILPLEKITARTWDTLEQAQKDCPNVIRAVRPKANWALLTENL